MSSCWVLAWLALTLSFLLHFPFSSPDEWSGVSSFLEVPVERSQHEELLLPNFNFVLVVQEEVRARAMQRQNWRGGEEKEGQEGNK